MKGEGEREKNFGIDFSGEKFMKRGFAALKKAKLALIVYYRHLGHTATSIISVFEEGVKSSSTGSR